MIKMPTKYLVLLWIIGAFADLLYAITAELNDLHHGMAIQFLYTRSHLLDLRYALHQDLQLETGIPDCILWNTIKTSRHKNSKKRGSRRGVRNRLKRRGRRLPLPAITLSNVRHLHNKMNELSALIMNDGDYRCTSLFCFTEAWLSDNISNIDPDGYTIIYASTGIL